MIVKQVQRKNEEESTSLTLLSVKTADSPSFQPFQPNGFNSIIEGLQTKSRAASGIWNFLYDILIYNDKGFK